MWRGVAVSKDNLLKVTQPASGGASIQSQIISSLGSLVLFSSFPQGCWIQEEEHTENSTET